MEAEELEFWGRVTGTADLIGSLNCVAPNAVYNTKFNFFVTKD